MSFKDHFSVNSAAYRANRPRYDDALARLMAAGLPGCDVAVDVGCGNGQFTVRLADHFDRVYGYDGSAEQIREAEARPNIEYRTATAEAVEVGVGTADLITAMQAAHWFDLPAFYHAADRALKPGGRLALVGYGLMDIEPGLDKVIYHFYSETVGAYWPPDRLLIEQKYDSLPFPYEEQPDPGHVLTSDWTFEQLVKYLGTWSAVTRATRQLGHNPLDAFVPDLKEAWGHAETRTMRWPLFMRWGLKP